MQNILVVVISLLLGGLGAWIIKNYGDRLGIIDVPNERSSHTEIIPKGGGIGILSAFVFCAFLLGFSRTFWIPALVLSIVSFFGDRIELSAKLRLIVQFLCCLIVLMGLDYSIYPYFFGFLLVLPFAVFIVGTSNFFNFMDGINGIAGITGVVGFLLLAAFGIATEAEPKYVTGSVAIACSCLGFLPYNIPKAKVFMGDVGSILLGFVFASMVVIMSRGLLDFICLAGFLFPFYADELTTMFARIKNSESLGKPHRRHLYQILANECGIEHWKISVGYGAIQLIIGLVLIVFRSKWSFVLIFLTLCFLVFSLVSALFRYGAYGKVSQEEV